MAKEVQFARTVSELADTLVAEFDLVELLTLLSNRCVAILQVEAAGLMLVAPDGALRMMASSSEAMRVLELFELQSQEGPCMDCYRTGQPVLNQYLSFANAQWPRFTREAVAAGFSSTHALPLRLRGTVIGALSLFCIGLGGLEQRDIDCAQALADIACIAIVQNRATIEAHVINEQLHHALRSRIAIEQAKGIIGEHGHVTMEQALSALRNYARRHNLLLAELADAVVEGSLTLSVLEV